MTTQDTPGREAETVRFITSLVKNAPPLSPAAAAQLRAIFDTPSLSAPGDVLPPTPLGVLRLNIRDVLLDLTWDSLAFIRRTAERLDMTPEELVEKAVAAYVGKTANTVEWAVRSHPGGLSTSCDDEDSAWAVARDVAKMTPSGAHVMRKVDDGPWEMDAYVRNSRGAE